MINNKINAEPEDLSEKVKEVLSLETPLLQENRLTRPNFDRDQLLKNKVRAKVTTFFDPVD